MVPCKETQLSRSPFLLAILAGSPIWEDTYVNCLENFIWIMWVCNTNRPEKLHRVQKHLFKYQISFSFFLRRGRDSQSLCCRVNQMSLELYVQNAIQIGNGLLPFLSYRIARRQARDGLIILECAARYE